MTKYSIRKRTQWYDHLAGYTSEPVGYSLADAEKHAEFLKDVEIVPVPDQPPCRPL